MIYAFLHPKRFWLDVIWWPLMDGPLYRAWGWIGERGYRLRRSWWVAVNNDRAAKAYLKRARCKHRNATVKRVYFLPRVTDHLMGCPDCEQTYWVTNDIKEQE